MNAQVQLINNQETELINVENLNDLRSFDYVDSYGANNHICIYDNGINIIRKDDNHITEVCLFIDKSYIKVISEEGNLIFDAKVIAFTQNNDIISLVYSISDETKKIVIKYTGD